ncbi:dihydrodipicolinate synthase family protein [Micromonospora sp. NPDC005367]|uniref:dihydrodipicolinate synthase family protein n=1 Tax=Micromonospora sp. NPDC005367 TaxID=3155590 RepID=UPI0033B6480C
MSASVRLPRSDGTVEERRLAEPARWPRPSGPITSRVAFAAAHVVADPLGDNTPGAPAALDWEATLAFRRHLWSYGLGVAEAMDTAQRGMGLDWASTRELIARSAEAAREVGGRIAAGAGTDHAPADLGSLDAVTAAYCEQIEVVEASGAQVILMASRQLARLARAPEDYAEVYGRLLEQVSGPVILHWLGPMFDPALHGYWGSPEVPAATDAFLGLVGQHAGKVDGVKVSLLDAGHERGLRAALPAGVRLYTGDDFNYPELIRGDGTHHSDALLGVFAAIAPAASAALQALDAGDLPRYDETFAPTLPLARHIFTAPTWYYKTGIAFLAWLSGHQPGFTMVGGLQSARSVLHLAELARLADDARLLPDPDLAAARLRAFLDVAGVPR